MKRLIPGGFLLAIEGIDGAGKSLQAQAVARALAARGLEVVTTREPTDGPWRRKLRESASTGRLSPADELKAFVEDRKQHVHDLIRPSLDAGRIVITDRYYYSTVAYQGARGFDTGELLRLNQAIAIEPDLVVLVDIEPAIGLARIGQRDGAANQFEGFAELSRVRDIFLGLCRPGWLRVDGMGPAHEIRDEILFAFGRVALERLRLQTGLTPRQRVNASLALHGSDGLAD